MSGSLTKIALLFLFLGVTGMYAYGQADTTKQTLYLVVKVDGTEYYGYILSDDGRELELNTKSIGRIFIPKSEIKEISKVDDVEVDGEDGLPYKDYRNQGPFTTRYFLTTNAHPIEKGHHYALIHLYGPEVHFAVTDQFSVGIMGSWAASPIGVATKYAFKSKGNTHFALGTIMASSGYLAQTKAFGGLHWATITQGSRKANISLSMGYAYANLNNVFELDDKYSFNDDKGNYFVPYDAVDDLNTQLYGKDYDWEDQVFYKPFSGSFVAGLSGITPVGKKASFILDAMAFFGHAHTVKYHDYPVTVTYNSYQSGTITQNFVIGKGEVVQNGASTSLIVMPAMRFSNGYDRSFQIALSGFININKERVLTFPVPLISWMRQF